MIPELTSGMCVRPLLRAKVAALLDELGPP